MHAERIDPEPVGTLGVARGDVPRHALVEAESGEQPERSGEARFAMPPLFFHGGETRRSGKVADIPGSVSWFRHKDKDMRKAFTVSVRPWGRPGCRSAVQIG